MATAKKMPAKVAPKALTKQSNEEAKKVNGKIAKKAAPKKK